MYSERLAFSETEIKNPHRF